MGSGKESSSDPTMLAFVALAASGLNLRPMMQMPGVSTGPKKLLVIGGNGFVRQPCAYTCRRTAHRHLSC